MSARRQMTMRAKVERDVAAGSDTWGDSAEPSWVGHLYDLPCRVWFGAEREVTDGTKTAAVEDRRAIVPLGTDITERDRIAQVTDRTGTEILFSGPIRIESVGRRKDHLALMLEAV